MPICSESVLSPHPNILLIPGKNMIGLWFMSDNTGKLYFYLKLDVLLIIFMIHQG